LSGSIGSYRETSFATAFFGYMSFALFITIAILAYIVYSFDKIVSYPNKILIYWGVLAFIFLALKIKLFRKAPWRLIFMLLATFLALRYLYWRTFETLTYTGSASFVAMGALYLAEVHGITLHLLSMFINIWPINRRGYRLDNWSKESLPTVDILIPTYSESEEIVHITCSATKNIDYPPEKLNIYIIDDGATLARRRNPKTSKSAWKRYYQFRKLAEKVGVGYITRNENDKAKAGNINNAMVHTNGELVLILDCDHVPTRDILANTVSYFMADKKLFLAQTPHFFINQTPIEHSVDSNSKMSVENDMFFRIIHTGLDFWNGSYFCGSAALLRRKYLEENGGVSGETITEDAETSLSLHAMGYNSVYVNYPMVCGLSPETFDDYITQRTRWAQGMLQIFLLRNLLTMKGLSFAQRICYFNSSFFWFFGLSRFMFYIAPSLFLIFGLMVYNASISQIVVYALPYLFSTTIVMEFYFGRARQPIFSEIYESVQALFLLHAIISVILNPRKPMFKVTPKGSTIEQDSLHPMASSFLIVIAINMVAIYSGVVKWVEYPLYRDVLFFTSLWCAYNIVMVVISIGAFWEKKQVRSHHRINTTGEVTVTLPETSQTVECEIRDISMRGLGFVGKFEIPPKPNGKVILDILYKKSGESFHFEGNFHRVAPIGEDGRLFCGVEFSNVEADFDRIVAFVYGSSQRWAAIWDGKSNFTGTVKLLGDLFKAGLKGIYELLSEMIRKKVKSIKEFFRRMQVAK